MTLLRQRMIEDLTIRNYSPRTVEVYVDRVATFAQHFGQSPDKLGLAEIREFQVFLVQQKKCSWALLNQTVCALRFFYKICLGKEWMIDHILYAKQPKKLPVVLSLDEVADVIGALANLKHRTLLMTLYATGARIAGDPKHVGARIGFTAVLHTWGQTLLHHPHVHCLVPAGGLSPDRRRWVAAREHFFLPVRMLSRLFREKYLAYLREAYRNEKLRFEGRLQHLAVPGAWRAFLDGLRRIEWVVYAKPPFGSPEQVLKYLARYTYRVAISNRRLLAMEGGFVAFRYKDYRRDRSDRVMRLSAAEFIRRFLLHVLPKRFVRIRHYGLLANRARSENLALCRCLLGSSDAPETPSDGLPPIPSGNAHHRPPSESRVNCCPACKKGHLNFVMLVPPPRAGPQPPINDLAYP